MLQTIAANERASRVLVAEWRDLAIFNFAIDPVVLQSFVPRGTELDTWNSTTFVSVVGFRFLDTRVLGLRVPRHVNFGEVNLRFYVRRRDPSGWRRGVVFLRELVPRRLIAWTARLWYNEPYVALPMRHVVDQNTDGSATTVQYEWHHGGAWESIAVRATGDAVPPLPGSAEEFITEHYWGYTRQRYGSTIEYRVAHPPWRVRHVTDFRLTCDVESLYGPAFREALESSPHSVFFADGSPVTIFRPRRL